MLKHRPKIDPTSHPEWPMNRKSDIAKNATPPIRKHDFWGAGRPQNRRQIVNNCFQNPMRESIEFWHVLLTCLVNFGPQNRQKNDQKKTKKGAQGDWTWPGGGSESAFGTWYHNALCGYLLPVRVSCFYSLLQFAISCSLLLFAAICRKLLQVATMCCYLLPLCCYLLLFAAIAAICCSLLLLAALCCYLLLLVAICSYLVLVGATCCSLLLLVTICW